MGEFFPRELFEAVINEAAGGPQIAQGWQKLCVDTVSRQSGVESGGIRAVLATPGNLVQLTRGVKRKLTMNDRKGIAVVEATETQDSSFATPQFQPILTNAGAGQTFTMLGTSMRLIATAASTGGRYTVLEQVTPPGWGPPRHIHSREDEIFTFSRAATSCMSAVSVGRFPLAPLRSCPAAFHMAFAT
jgi:hypothetical protein